MQGTPGTPLGGLLPEKTPQAKPWKWAGEARAPRLSRGSGLKASLPLADAIPNMPEKGAGQLMRGPWRA